MDVELIRSLEPIIEKGPYFAEQSKGRVNSGLGMAAESGMQIYREVLDRYNDLHFSMEKDSNNQVTVVQHLSEILVEHGYNPEKDSIQTVEGINIYPSNYFNPQNYEIGSINVTENTYSIHHYAESWKSPCDRWIHSTELYFGRKFGESFGRKVGRRVTLPIRIVKKITTNGLISTFKFAINKLKHN